MSFIADVENSKLIDGFLKDELALNIAVAFLGKDAWKYFENSKNSISIICNLESGATNPCVVQKLMDKKNIEIKTNPQLHTKVYIGEDKLIVGSSNLSANGLSYEDDEIRGWIEASLTSCDKKEIDQANIWYRKIWEASKNIQPSDIKKYKEIWKNRRNNRPMIQQQNKSLIDAAIADSKAFEDRGIYFGIYSENLSEEANKKFDEIKEEYLSIPEQLACFEDWEELPDNAYIISLYYDSDTDEKEFDGIYRMPAEPLIEKFEKDNKTKGSIKICFDKKNIYGYTLKKEDQEIILGKINELYEYVDKRSCVPFIKGIKIINKNNI